MSKIRKSDRFLRSQRSLEQRDSTDSNGTIPLDTVPSLNGDSEYDEPLDDNNHIGIRPIDIESKGTSVSGDDGSDGANSVDSDVFIDTSLIKTEPDDDDDDDDDDVVMLDDDNYANSDSRVDTMGYTICDNGSADSQDAHHTSSHVQLYSDSSAIQDEYQCPICGYRCPRLDELDKHLEAHINHEENERQQAKQYENRFGEGNEVTSSTYDKKRLTCNLCQKTMSSISSLRSHMYTHSTDRTIECKECSARFKHPTSLNHHLRLGRCPGSNQARPERDHAREAEVSKCKQCFEIFDNRHALKKHMMTNHKKVGKNQCEHCGRTCKNEYHLRYHIGNIHRGNENVIRLRESDRWQCKLCDKICSRIDNLKAHIMLHTDEKKNTCSGCGGNFVSSNALYYHARNCTHLLAENENGGASYESQQVGKKKVVSKGYRGTPIPCHVCKATFRDSYGLDIHMAVHTGAKRFRCSKCDAAFKYPSSLNDHNLSCPGKNKQQHSEEIVIQDDENTQEVAENTKEVVENTKEVVVTTKEVVGSNDLQCVKCHKTFIRTASLHVHNCPSVDEHSTKLFTMVTKADETFAYKCFCGQQFDELPSLKDHIIGHMDIKKYECTFCHQEVKYLASLNVHMMYHVDKDTNTCKICNSSFSSVDSLKNHLNVHTGITDLMMSMQAKFRGDHFLSMYMDAGYPEEKDLQKEHHIKKKPISQRATHQPGNKSKVIQCKKCMKTFSKNTSMHTHSCPSADENSYKECELLHDGVTYRCFCGRRLMNQHSLRVHIIVHMNFEKYECMHCRHQFKHSCNLSVHMISHADMPKRTCCICSQSFKTVDDLKSHLMVHTRETDMFRSIQNNLTKDTPDSTPQIIQCKVCGIKLPSYAEYKTHSQQHTRKFSNIQCDFCFKKLTLVRNLRRHLINLHCSNRRECCYCSKVCVSSVELNAHLIAKHSSEIRRRPQSRANVPHRSADSYQHEQTNPYGVVNIIHHCKFCGQRYTLRHSLKRHIINAHCGKENRKCCYCSKVFDGPLSLRTHLITHLNDSTVIYADDGSKQYRYSGNTSPSYHVVEPDENTKRNGSGNGLIVSRDAPPSRKFLSCRKCGQRFTKKILLQKHKKSCHSISAKINGYFYHRAMQMKSSEKCGICNKGFQYRSQLKVHVASHKKGDKYYCTKCNRFFDWRGSLKAHLEVHDRQETTCNKCGKHFTHKEYLAKHLVIHSDERKYKCNQCGEGFKQSGHIKTHMISHMSAITGSTCLRCGDEFDDTPALKLHTLSHLNMKNYRCNYCSKMFWLSDTWKKHVQQHKQERRNSADVDLSDEDEDCYDYDQEFDDFSDN